MRGTRATAFNSSQSGKIFESENTCKRMKHFKFSFCCSPFCCFLFAVADYLGSLMQQDPTLCSFTWLPQRQNVVVFPAPHLIPDGWLVVASVGDMRWATWWALSAVCSPIILHLLRSLHVSGSEIAWQGMCPLRAEPLIIWERGSISWVGKLSWWPELKSPSVYLQPLNQMNMPRAEMKLQ